MLTILAVIILVLIIVGALLGKIAWDRAIILCLVAAVIFAAIYFLAGGSARL